MSKSTQPNKKQEFFQSMVVGVLLYSVVLGFFNDYTDILYTSSYSITFLVAIVMQLLTYGTFAVKDWIKLLFKDKRGRWATFGLVFFVWLVLFLSKFVFLAVIEFLFPENVEISGFIGLLLIVASLTIAQKFVEIVYKKLGD